MTKLVVGQVRQCAVRVICEYLEKLELKDLPSRCPPVSSKVPAKSRPHATSSCQCHVMFGNHQPRKVADIIKSGIPKQAKLNSLCQGVLSQTSAASTFAPLRESQSNPKVVHVQDLVWRRDPKSFHHLFHHLRHSEHREQCVGRHTVSWNKWRLSLSLSQHSPLAWCLLVSVHTSTSPALRTCAN